MRPRVMLLLAALAAMPSLVDPAFAQRNLNVAAAPASEQRVALVIGNSAYKVDPLKNPVNDAEDVATALRSLGFRVTLRKDASHRQMIAAINEFGQELKKGGVGLFYYAGHGVQSRGRNFLVPVGAKVEGEADLEFESVDANRVLAYMEDAGNRVNIVIMDACRNNPYARSFRSSSRGLAPMDAAKGSFLAYATAPGSVAADGSGRNGLYTQHLLASLRQTDSDIDKVFRRVTAEVSRTTGGKQVPWVSSSLTGDFYFRAGTQVASVAPSASLAASANPAADDRAFWESIKDSRDPEEFKAYLEQFPNGRFAGLARTRVKSLTAAARPPVQVATVAPSTQTTPASVAALADSLQRLNPGTAFKDCDACPEMVVIPAGSYEMGSPASEQSRLDSEGPQHQVTIARQFAAGKFEVTFDEWDACVRESGCGHNPDDQGWGRGRRPVMRVSWDDAKQYVQWLSRKTGRNYRLLTEAEWEYVARAGTTTAFSWGNSITPQQANYDAKVSYAGSPVATSARGQTAPVGSYAPNAFGLYDVHGNVWEWTEDCWNSNYNGAPGDGSARTSGECGQRVLRGGSWFFNPRRLRSAARFGNDTGIRNGGLGFRVARTN